MGLFTLFTYLKTKESHDRRITRRVWEFRQQISKAKYPKISQKYRSEISGRFRRTPLHCTERKTLQVSVIRRSGYVYPEKLKCPPLTSGCEISGCKMSAHGIPDMKCRRTEFRMWNVSAWNSSPGGLSYAAQGGPSACARCRDPSSGWHGVRMAIRINSIWIP